jgi:purine catabolism regulator
VLGSPSLNEAATSLGVHRNTVAYRVARLEELADWDLTDPDLRFALELAVRIVQNAQV